VASGRETTCQLWWKRVRDWEGKREFRHELISKDYKRQQVYRDRLIAQYFEEQLRTFASCQSSEQFFFPSFLSPPSFKGIRRQPEGPDPRDETGPSRSKLLN